MFCCRKCYIFIDAVTENITFKMDSIMKNIVNQIKEAVCNMKPQFTCACKNKTTELLVDNSINNEISCAISESIANSQTQKEYKTASITEIA